ncbi:MAG: alpha-amylase family glycosyl hydrolase [Synechococcaceae cyanobacterium]|nr:alpha-amylase family glycosyl hydrolase [Synechococcaceae cyanobacterium]
MLASLCASTGLVVAADQPVAILHAHDEAYQAVANYVCTLPAQGYSHIQIAPAQQSHPGPIAPPMGWSARYQPIDYRVIDGRGSETELKSLTSKAHSCGMKVIADVVFNHMATMEAYKNLRFPTFGPSDFHLRCRIDYTNGKTADERECWLGQGMDLPDLIQNDHAMEIQKAHLQKLFDLGIDGFRFDAAKHMEPATIKQYIDFINKATKGAAWNYLEVIVYGDTTTDQYTPVAAITDFTPCDSMRQAFEGSGDHRSLRVPIGLSDPRSVTFGINHDTDPEINPGSPSCKYGHRGDGVLATANVLARESGTPLILGKNNLTIAYVPTGVRFRQIMAQRQREAKNVRENVLAAIDSLTLLLMERGCYRELRNGFSVAIERRSDGKKSVTRWGTSRRGGVEVQGRDALFFEREPLAHCAGG